MESFVSDVKKQYIWEQENPEKASGQMTTDDRKGVEGTAPHDGLVARPTIRGEMGYTPR